MILEVETIKKEVIQFKSIRGIKRGAQKKENPVIADWVPISGGRTEGLLGGRLAQRQAALRGVVAAGARFDFTLVSRACRLDIEHLTCHRKLFLECSGYW